MQALTNFYHAIPTVVWTITDLLIRAAAVLFIYFSTKFRGGKHKPLYYVLAILFPLVGVVVFAVKRKSMTGAGMNQCPYCGSYYPPEFKYCYKCNVELPEYDEKKHDSFKMLAKIAFAAFVIFYVWSYLFTPVEIKDLVDSFKETLSQVSDESSYGRISFTDENGNEVYYDKNGNTYSDSDEVVLYSKKGVEYVYDEELYAYSGSNGATVDASEAYVDSNGYFVRDKDYEFWVYDETDDAVSYLDMFTQPYYENPYFDNDGNKYYPADSASWTKDGKLIVDDSFLEQ